MNEQKVALAGLFAVSFLWGCNYVISAYLLGDFSPIFLSFARLVMTSLFFLTLALARGGLRFPTRPEIYLLLGSGIFGTLLNQTLYFTGLRQSTAANASLIIALAPVATAILERALFGVRMTPSKLVGVALGVVGVLIIVGMGGSRLSASVGDFYLLGAMLTLSISILFVRSLTKTMPTYTITIVSTWIGTTFMAPAAGVEAAFHQSHLATGVFPWVLLALAGVVAQGLAGFWWNRGVAVIGAGAAAMFMNLPPFIALLAGHFILRDAITASQVVGGLLVLSGVFVANSQALRKVSPLPLQEGFEGSA
ncbi:DMT family transporter [Ferroacidibacillus organovorans]|uniref:EamA domain-containing protein n=1 Tax=Ferroacidibacillus organovorans TaxID=1765683 RepID=A0A162TF52_9BACL|nr:DMT family transporter [Ferroacidibacillus organovorans]KYP80743.1 hypothetical protein AYJ22_10025 [Ferroacidibacillus organovorans]OAG93861.1 hypothetical protein AYW79_08355 [Ferroacidibacillus organovorans]OPG15878.1 hypothetical protein B2M26_09740 [Ferroacidibacillus organovorans]